MYLSLRGCLRATLFFVALLSQQGAFAQPAPIFDVLEFQIQGNTVLSVEAIELAVTPFLGEGKQMAAVEAARLALEKAYQGAGFLTVFVDVPEQRVDGGVVILNVTEGRIARLKVSGSRYFSQGYIREKVAELTDGKVPNFNEVQRQLALVNRTEERRVQPIMRAGVTPGTVETELKVEDKLPLFGTFEVNNRSAADTSLLRLSATARYENMFQLDHSLAVSFSTAPQNTAQSQVLSINYTIPSTDQGAWVGYLVNSNSKVAALGDVNVLGKGQTLGLRYVRPVASAATDETHSISLGVDYKNLKEDTSSPGNVISTPLRYLPFQFGYNGSFEHGARRNTLVSLQMAAAFRPILRRDVDCPGGTADQFACKRQGGDGGFATLRTDVRQSVPLGTSTGTSTGTGLSGSLNLRLGGQLATGAVPNGEQYTIGGAETVRGYREAEGAGDRGVLASVEWRSADLGVRFARWTSADAVSSSVASTSGSTNTSAGNAWISQSFVLAFIDVARTYVFEPATGQAPHISLAGAGVGLRLKVRKSVSGELDLAWPLKASLATPERGVRAHVRVVADF